MRACHPAGASPCWFAVSAASLKFSGVRRATGGQWGGIGGIRRACICLADSRNALFVLSTQRLGQFTSSCA